MCAIKWDDKKNVILKLYIQPKASRDQWVGLHDNEIKIAITAPPVDGKANSHLIKFLAKQFGVPKGNVIIDKGLTGRHKQIKVISPQQIPDPLSTLFSE